MAIVVKNITIPTDSNFVIAKGINIDKVVAKGVTVWEKNIIKTVNNAPPFAGVGWQLYSISGNWWFPDGILEGTPFLYSQDEIKQNEISVYFHLIGEDKECRIICSPLFNTSKYTGVNFSYTTWFNDPNVDYIVRHSNDGNNWTRWRLGRTFDKAYTYAQAGLFIDAGQDEDEGDCGYGCTVTGAAFY